MFQIKGIHCRSTNKRCLFGTWHFLSLPVLVIEYRLCLCGVWSRITHGRDHFVNAPSQWESTLQCNVVSHWLDALKNAPCYGCNYGTILTEVPFLQLRLFIYCHWINVYFEIIINNCDDTYIINTNHTLSKTMKTKQFTLKWKILQ